MKTSEATGKGKSTDSIKSRDPYDLFIVVTVII